MLCKPRSHPFGMLQKLVGTVLDAGGLAAKKKRRERMISSVFNYNTKKKKKGHTSFVVRALLVKS